MLGLLYFPQEHKYAVYTPLFGPIAIPLLATSAREFFKWRKGRRRTKTE
jgi:phosphatidylinositol glycan class S